MCNQRQVSSYVLCDGTRIALLASLVGIGSVLEKAPMVATVEAHIRAQVVCVSSLE